MYSYVKMTYVCVVIINIDYYLVENSWSLLFTIITSTFLLPFLSHRTSITARVYACPGEISAAGKHI